ncbi:hypothetical protein DFH94DRAFT_842406 [Russula ochroleuca]|uniref:ubiquitinyl hydrolase 1 n=1 Tax=Russula ochroleuca TaxID=152965 RepID=A0A9P5N234_9AGAM|nr:hypothetical protein DFH94DRAFT_842406 [Russula ochroleuca]
MSQPADLEGGNNADGGQTQPTRNQPAQEPSHGESNFGDSSGPLFSIYSKTAEEEDNKMVERWQKDADGILIFTGLFSAAVAALLAVTVQDLRPNSQDTSAFYLGNIYDVLADPNATRASNPSPAKPPPFSRPRYAVWVNSLWFLSLVMSLSCALWATSLHQWARRYIRLTQPGRCSPEKRARMHAFFADGVEKMHIPWAVEGLPTLLHLSLFLFFGGLAIFLYNVDQEVFMYHFYDLRICYRGWMLGGLEKAAEEMASERSSEIDVRILGWTISALGDDDSLERFFEAIPGFFKSKLVEDLEKDFPETHLKTFWSALDGFMGRTSNSNSVTESVKSRRDVICRDIISMIPCPDYYYYNLQSHIKAPVSIESLQTMARWVANLSHDVSNTARIRVARSLLKIQERDNRWIALASNAYGLAVHNIGPNVALGGDNVLLAFLIHVSRQADKEELVYALTQIDVRHTIPGLQHEFCTVWNELVQEARNQGSYGPPVDILLMIRHLYITLHQGTDAAPTAFSASTPDSDSILYYPLSYPLCDIASHRSDWTTPVPLTQPAIPSPPDPTTPTEIGDSPQAPATTSPALPVHTSPRSTDAPPPRAVATALRDIPPASESSRPLEGTAQQDIVAPCIEVIEPDISEIMSAASTPAPTPTLTPVPPSTPPVLNTSLTSCDAGVASASEPLLPASSIVSFSIPASPPPPSRAPPFPKTPSHPTGNTTPPRLRARGLVNSGNMCFANSVLHLLVHSPPFWNLFRELGDLKGQRGAGGPETGGGSTPLVDATMGFFEEFMFREKVPPPTQQSLQLVARGESRQDEGEKEENKEKTQLRNMLDGKTEDAEEFLGLYLDALDTELVELHTYISTHKPASAPSVEELEEEARSAEGQTTAARKRDFTASSVESPISRIFGGRSRSTVRVRSQPDAVTIEAWRSLKLHIQPDSVHAIQDALAHVSQPQPVQVGQSSSREASQQVLLEALPPVLVVHLERFPYNVAADDIKKISKPVQFTPELEIPLEIMAPVAGKSAERVHYKLYGVLYHHGESAGSGHYTVDVLHPNGDSGSDEAWLHIDDEAVSAVGHEDVFGGHDKFRGFMPNSACKIVGFRAPLCMGTELFNPKSSYSVSSRTLPVLSPTASACTPPRPASPPPPDVLGPVEADLPEAAPGLTAEENPDSRRGPLLNKILKKFCNTS